MKESTQQNTYFKILELFQLGTESIESRKWMQKPFYIGDFAMSTNSYCLCFFDKKLTTNLDFCQKEYPESLISLIPNFHDELSPIKNIRVDFLLKKIFDNNLDDNSIQSIVVCEACGGKGQVNYSFSFDNKDYKTKEDCPVCNGTGELIKVNFIKIGESFFNTKHIFKIMNAAILLDHEEIQLIHQNTENSVFKIKDVYVKIVCMNKAIVNNNIEVNELLLTIE